MYVQLLIEEVENKKEEIGALKKLGNLLFKKPASYVAEKFTALGKWLKGEKVEEVKKNTLLKKLDAFFSKIPGYEKVKGWFREDTKLGKFVRTVAKFINENKISLAAAAALFLATIANIVYGKIKNIKEKINSVAYWKKLIEELKKETNTVLKVVMLALNVLAAGGLVLLFGKGIKAIVNKIKMMFKKEEGEK